ncbi:MAG TPA: hypothetical protein VF972_07585 [Actinomycetota bacterium]
MHHQPHQGNHGNNKAKNIPQNASKAARDFLATLDDDDWETLNYVRDNLSDTEHGSPQEQHVKAQVV